MAWPCRQCGATDTLFLTAARVALCTAFLVCVLDVLAEANGLQDIKIADWSNEVAPFWGEVVKSALTSEGILGLLKAGWTTIKGVYVVGGARWWQSVLKHRARAVQACR